MRGYRILSLDGGGVRGVYTARLLERLEAAQPGFLASVDLFAGTSTGSILALALAAGREPGELVELYRQHAARIFDDSWRDDLLDLGRLIGADYRLDGLLAVLTEAFADLTLRDLPRHALISSFDLDPGRDANPRAFQPAFFHNFPCESSQCDERLVDVAARSCAAPTYFPSYQGFVDGGVVANNPAMCALAQALDAETGGQQLDDLRLLSLGAGHNPIYVGGSELDWGEWQWRKLLVSLTIEGSMGIANYQCKRLLGPRYLRLAPKLPTSVPLDAVERVEDLITWASSVPVDAALTFLRSERWSG